MEKLLEDFYNKHADVLVFRSGGKEAWMDKLKQSYELLGSTIKNRKTNEATTQSQFEEVALKFAKENLSVKSTSKYIPDIIDTRTEEQMTKHAELVEKVVTDFFDRFGYAFKGEIVGHTDLRKSVAAEISQHYLFESDSANELVFRRHINGAFGPTIKPKELLDKLVGPYLDSKATFLKQNEIKAAIEEKARKGYPDKMSDRQFQLFQDDVRTLMEQSSKAFTSKALPVLPEEAYRREFEKQAMFSLGATSKKELTLDQLRNIENFPNQKLAELYALPTLRTKVIDPPKELWAGYESVENKNGKYLMPTQF